MKQEHTLLYRPFSSLEVSSDSGKPRRLAMIETIEEHIRARHWYAARESAAELIETTLEGLRYLQTYVLRTLSALVLTL
jgi:hypothetical protein